MPKPAIPIDMRGRRGRAVRRRRKFGLWRVLFYSLLLCLQLRSCLGPEAFYAEEDTLNARMETAILLEESRWQSLSVAERVEVLEEMAIVEANYLGVPKPLRVEAAEMKEAICGAYHAETLTILLNETGLRNRTSWQSLNTLCHEAYHAYQRTMVEAYEDLNREEQQLLLFEKAKTYAAEFADYQDGSNFAAYYNQQVEADARRYAEASVLEYHGRIMAYLQEGHAA